MPKSRKEKERRRREIYRNAIRILPLTKRCSKCRVDKAASDFTTNTSNKSGLSSQCKVCCMAAQRLRRATTEWADKNMLRLYGVTFEYLEKLFEKLFEKQKGKCAICGIVKPFRAGAGSASIHIDHDHMTGRVRGLLCQDCNHGIGKFKDSPELIRSAIYYLEAHGK